MAASSRKRFGGKIMYKLVFLVIGLLCINIAFAADSPVAVIPTPDSTLRVGVLDIDQLMTKTKSSDRAMKKILKQYEPEGKALEREERTFRSTLKKYNAMSERLRPDEIKEWQHKINAIQEQLLRKQSLLQEKIMAAEEQETQKIIAHYFNLVSQVAKKSNLTLVFFKDITAYNLPGIAVSDITEQIIDMSKGKSATSAKKIPAGKKPPNKKTLNKSKA